MALRFLTTIPIFAPPTVNPSSTHTKTLQTELHFARWHNANAAHFEARRRAQEDIERDIRLTRRFNAADKITKTTHTNTPPPYPTPSLKSTGTPSTPSKPSIPGRRSKYSKPPKFRTILPNEASPNNENTHTTMYKKENVVVTEDGVSYKVEGVPFEFMYSYTETPKVKPIALREEPYSPFGPVTMGRPWTGKAPLAPSKKNLKEFDSFVLPPPHKKGVKPVQSPGPFLPGSGPKYVRSREEILGEPLTRDEINSMVESCLRTSRQLNIGRDGLTHNMLDNIHAHWKRRRVCKIKCKGVCTVDMDNVKHQLEDKTGGKVIYERGGVLFLFRGRNYNYRTRPRFPLMLWKPVSPVYPRLVKRAPEGLTVEEATIMRKKGRALIPICKLGKNGVYKDLLPQVREAFEACELVRINCQGMNGSDYRKIGGKLKDLVPCVLISFELEHILMWRGPEWKSTLLSSEDNYTEPEKGDGVLPSLTPEALQPLMVTTPPITLVDSADQGIGSASIPTGSADAIYESGHYATTESENNTPAPGIVVPEIINELVESETPMKEITIFVDNQCGRDFTTTCSDSEEEAAEAVSCKGHGASNDIGLSRIQNPTSKPQDFISEPVKLSTSIDVVKQLWQRALDQGAALFLEDAPLNADVVHARAVAFSQSAPSGPMFSFYPRRAPYTKPVRQEATEGVEEAAILSGEVDDVKEEITPIRLPPPPPKKASERKTFRSRINNEVFKEDQKNVARGTLGVDELANLLA